MKRSATRVGSITWCIVLLSLAGCVGWFRQSTTPTTAYKPVHQQALGGEVQGLDEALRQNPASLNLGDANGNTPLILAALHGHVDAVRFLLQRGALINKTNNQHQSALILAAKAGQTDVVTTLLRARADTSIRDSRGWDAATWAQRQGYPQVAQAIKSVHR